MGTSFGGKVAAWIAVQRPELLISLILEAPAAIRPDGGAGPVSGSPEAIARRLYAHPESMPPMPQVAPELAARRLSFVSRLRGPGRDPELEAGLREAATPTLVLFGTQDGVIPPDMGRIYPELMPNAHLVFIYDAGHAIAAERPAAFVEVVADFLERNDAFVISRNRTAIFP
jgi:pimeloyl-ACP methyl ester carboxylesterase